MTAPDGRARPEDQTAAVATAAERIAAVVAEGHDVVVTHGNGPQVGNLLVKNEVAAGVVPPVPLDWCGAQTQGTIGVLVLNALEAVEPVHDRPKRLSVHSGRGEGNVIVIAVTDNGIGLSCDAAFEPFVTTKPEGMGLGLAICKMIVEQHGGELSATSADDGGAQFGITLPTATATETSRRSTDEKGIDSIPSAEVESNRVQPK